MKPNDIHHSNVELDDATCAGIHERRLYIKIGGDVETYTHKNTGDALDDFDRISKLWADQFELNAEVEKGKAKT